MLLNNRKLFFYLFILLVTLLSAQTPPDSINGSSLRNWIKQNYYNGIQHSLGYDSARIYMYGFIDNRQNSLVGVYSGYIHSLTYGTITTYPKPINCEHTIPQSWFTHESVRRSDLFHLYPTYENWNSKRDILPFAEIPTSQVNEWYKGNQSFSGTPSGDLADYSRLKTHVAFEPRLVHKGDLARAAFYFYTMYPDVEGGLERLGDPQMFLKWHAIDQLSATERERNDLIQHYQGNRNPYIDHPEWVARAWNLLSDSTPPGPGNFSMSAAGDSVVLQWTDIAGENGYILFRSTNQNEFQEYVRLDSNVTKFVDMLDQADEYHYYLRAWNYYGSSEKTPVFSTTYTSITVDRPLFSRPEKSSEVSMFPNPFNAVSQIQIDIQEASHYDINVFNTSGQLLNKIFSGILSTGKNKITWHPENLSSGIYFIHINSENEKLILRGYYLK